MNTAIHSSIFLACVLTMGLCAQEPIVNKPFPNDDSLANPPMQSVAAASQLMERNFFSPELVMKHQKAIGLSAEQQASIRTHLQKSNATFTSLQWQQSAEVETLNALITKDRLDKKAVLGQLDTLLAVENQMKRLSAEILVHIKNTLTAEQQSLLLELKQKGTPLEKKLRGAKDGK